MSSLHKYVKPAILVPVNVVVREVDAELGRKLQELFSIWLFMNGVRIENPDFALPDPTAKIEELRQLVEEKSLLLQLFVHDQPTYKPNQAVENVAKVIYEQWRSMPGFVEWQEGGNSHRQTEARELARKALCGDEIPKASWSELDESLKSRPSEFPQTVKMPQREVVVQVYGPPGSGVCNLSAYLGHFLKDFGYKVDVNSRRQRLIEEEPLFKTLTKEQLTNHIECWGENAPSFRIEAVIVPVTHFE